MADKKKCSACQGRGVIPYGTSDLKCVACDGTGTPSTAPSSPKDG